MHWKLFVSAIIHGILGTFSFYLSPALNPIEFFVKRWIGHVIHHDHDSTEVSSVWSATNAAFTVGFLFSAWINGYCTDKFGRRTTLMVINNLLLILSSFLHYFARSYDQIALLIIGRLIAGICLQVALFLYILGIECSPTNQRQTVVIVLRTGFVITYILGSASGLPQLLGRERYWQYIFLVPIGPALLHILLTPFFPESPKHLYITERNKEKARKSILFYHGTDVNLEEIEEEFEKEANLARTASVGICQTLKTRHLRWPFMLCLIAGIASRLGGFDIENFYSTGIMMSLGISAEDAPMYNVVILRLPGAVIVLLAVFVIRNVRTKPHLLVTLAGALLSVGMLMAAQFFHKSLLSVLALLLGITCWHLGNAYIPQMLVGELCPQVSRSLTTGWQTVVVALTSFSITAAFPPLTSLYGPWALAPMLVLGILCFIWLCIYLPETRGKTVEEVTRQWIDEDDLVPVLTDDDQLITIERSQSLPAIHFFALD